VASRFVGGKCFEGSFVGNQHPIRAQGSTHTWVAPALRCASTRARNSSGSSPRHHGVDQPTAEVVGEIRIAKTKEWAEGGRAQ